MLKTLCLKHKEYKHVAEVVMEVEVPKTPRDKKN